MKFDLAISIGINCQCRYNISRTLYRNAFGSDKGFRIGSKLLAEIDYGSFFFDWSVTPIHSAISVFENAFEGVLKCDNLQLRELADGTQTVVDVASGCEYPHTFPKTNVGKCSYELINSSFEEVSKKYMYVADKTLQALHSNAQILFVLTGNHASGDLCDVLSRYTCNFQVLYTPWENMPGFSGMPIQNPKVIQRPIQYAKYPGNLESWNIALHGIKLQRPKSEICQ